MIVYGIGILAGYFTEIITRKRIRYFMPLLTIVYMIIMMGGNTNNPDTIIYERMYYSSKFFDKDPGFGLLIDRAKAFGLGINEFRLVIAIIGLVLISSAANYFIKNIGIFYLIYFVYPFMMDVVQVRNFLAMCLVVFSLRFLVDESKKGPILCLLFIVMATLIQKTAIVYTPLFLFKYIEKKKLMKGILVIVAVISLIAGLNTQLVNRIAFVLLNTVSESLMGSAKFLSRNTNWGWLILWGEQFTNVFLVSWSLKAWNYAIRNYPEQIKSKQSLTRVQLYLELIFWINIYLFCFCPLYVININFYRIMRNIMVANAIVFALTIETKNLFARRKNRYVYIWAILAYVAFMFYVNYIYNGGGEYIKSILIPLIYDNWILGA